MRKFFSVVALATLSVVIAGCGGGESKFTDPGNTTPPPGGGTPPAPVVSSISIIASTPTLPSSGATPVEISAYARNADNAFIADMDVQFTATSGGLQITKGTTDENGLAKAVLTTAGDPSNRTITVTATAETISNTVTVDVSGSQLSVQGPNATVLGQTGTYSIALIDSDSKGIANQTVALTSARSNTLSAPSVTTNASGQATFTMTVANPGNDTLTATAMGSKSTLAVAVNNDSFEFTTPTTNAEVLLGANEPVTVRWKQGAALVVGQPITFASTRGTLSADTMVTDANGEASVTIAATNAGGAVITASGAGGASTQRALEFVATTAATLVVQPSVFTLGPTEQSTITATVRDPAGNLVKNKTVVFSLADVTGGTLTIASAVTDSQGRAQSAYVAGNTTSARDGVAVTATVQGSPTVKDVVMLTVAQRQVFIALGTGNKIGTNDAKTQYKIPYVIQVTDASGNGVANVPLALSALSLKYYKGERDDDVAGTPLNEAVGVPGGAPECSDEDANRNGQLDLDLNEDFNSSGRIEAGNIATVTPRNLVTDANGFANVEVVYPQEYAYWLKVSLEARTSVQGTEFVRSSVFVLPGLKDDFDGPEAPPGQVSPFGVNACNFAN